MTEPTLTDRVDLSLRTGQARDVSGLGGAVTLVGASRDFLVLDDGRSVHVTEGVLRFERGGVVAEIAFTSGKPFSHWGHDMAVFGTDSLELSVFPPGEAVRP